MKISVTEMDVFKTLLEYTVTLVGILVEYDLSEEDRTKLNAISEEIFTLDREDN